MTHTQPEAQRFTKKPVVIEAWQFTKANYREGVPIKFRHGTVVLWSQYGGDVIGGEIETLGGRHTVTENDWIICGVKGEFYPCKPDIFEMTYAPETKLQQQGKCLHQIDEPQAKALRLFHALPGGKLIDDSTEWADTLHDAAAELLRQHARIEELEAQLSAISAGDVEPLRKPASQHAAPPAVPDEKPLPELMMASYHEAIGWNACRAAMLAASPAHPAEGVPAQTDHATEFAPPNSLPTFDECVLRVENSNFLEKRAAGGGYGAEHDSKTASQLHRFIYEYDDADPVRSSWFLHRLELLLNEVRSATQPAAQGMDADLTDEQIDEAFNQMLDGAYGFLKSWGYRQFARAALAAQAKQGEQANG